MRFLPGSQHPSILPTGSLRSTVVLGRVQYWRRISGLACAAQALTGSFCPSLLAGCPSPVRLTASPPIKSPASYNARYGETLLACGFLVQFLSLLQVKLGKILKQSLRDFSPESGYLGIHDNCIGRRLRADCSLSGPRFWNLLGWGCFLAGPLHDMT